MINALIASIIRFADSLLSKTYLRVFTERQALLIFLFHGLFLDDAEIGLHLVHPQQGITISHFREFVDHFSHHGYRFVSPNDVITGLDPAGHYCLIAFDDGYYSNHRALPVLEQYNVPAVFFISSNHVQQGKMFWWDVIYRERWRARVAPAVIEQEINELKTKKTTDAEAYVKQRFGPDALRPLGDLDRPFTPSELREFAKNRHVVIGNHTADHALLTNYPLDEVREQIAQAQQALLEMTGIEPNSIAYPNGYYNRDIVEVTRQVGLKLGLTVDLRKNRLPLHPESPDLMRLGRLILNGGNIRRQCEVARSDLSLYNLIQSYRHRARET
jgi:peptidoglycan/xylan/chitin deacetylase (PgdA/CDA1 family)